MIAEEVVDNAEARGEILETAQPFDTVAIYFIETAGGNKTTRRRTFGIDLRRKIFPAHSCRNGEPVEIPGVHGVNAEVVIETRFGNGGCIEDSDVDGHTVLEIVIGIAIGNTIGKSGSGAVLDAKLDLVRARNIGSGGIPRVAVELVIVIHRAGKTAGE